ncbi:hypothetical protein SPRG_04506 [Saprolegnia parasitica CBS 223.65]|uniref:Uncharacterized protein n=1 Tax=Saprolegnia parasitica (strain CBS 223.65) TaxID=695850 RepID=A0A067CV04_SAPPC|nr:hypothetical protein SPRG_04506 [Saprolegnia parasitica CBS 223.65]KDO30607.1 hypothetical protein SPRG_04506 [Saprolegnia parasitica CBS 223.65]|eukprot:XP_012198818.1 hypothetical protein SPRG_04506 [Saprolegnia parasitica CBS 223.65]
MDLTWLAEARDAVRQSQDWRLLQNSIYTRVQTVLKQHKTKYFSDLGDDERALVMAQVELHVADDAAHSGFLQHITNVLDHHLSKAVESAYATAPDKATKKTLLLDAAADAAATLVVGLPPEQRSLLRLLLNTPFPIAFRRHAWQLFLSDAPLRVRYDAACALDRVSTISLLDADITDTCHRILEASSPLMETTTPRETWMIMKTVLSYAHATGAITNPHDDAMYALCVPLLLVYGTTSVSALVEAYCVLLRLPRPRLPDAVSSCLDALHRVHPPLHTHLVSVMGPTTSQAWLPLLTPFVEQLFVGVATKSVLLFVWDQLFLVGADRLLPDLVALALVALEGPLLRAQSLDDVLRAVHQPTLQVSTLQELLETFSLPTIRQDLQLIKETDFFKPALESPAPVVEAPSVELDATNALTPLLLDVAKTLCGVYTRDADYDKRGHQEQTTHADNANAFRPLLRQVAQTLSGVFTSSDDIFGRQAVADETRQRDLVAQSQKTAFGRTYTPNEIGQLSGKAKAAYEKRLPKFHAAYAALNQRS